MDSANSGTCSLRLVRNDGDLDSADRVYERRLANVGPANKGHKSATHSYRVVTNATQGAKKNLNDKILLAMHQRSPHLITRPDTL